MFSTLVKEISGYLDRRFITTVYAPSLAFWLLLLIIYVAARGVGADLAWWARQPLVIQTTLSAIFLGATVFFALLLQRSLTSLVRLYEGYWEGLPVLGWMARSAPEGQRHPLVRIVRRREHYKQELAALDGRLDALKARSDGYYQRLGGLGRQRAALLKELAEARATQAEARIAELTRKHAVLHEEEQAIRAQIAPLERERSAWYDRIYLAFPPATRADQVMPTRLGNVLKSAEYYPLMRYNMDAVLLWPRLYPLVPATFATSLDDARSGLDGMLVVSALSWALALIGGLGVVVLGGGAVLFLVVFWGGLVAGWMAYRAALEAALAYAQLIKAAFDLYRFSLVRSLGLKPPESLKQEQALWQAVTLFTYRNIPPNPELMVYKLPDAEEEKA